jgi:transposase
MRFDLSDEEWSVLEPLMPKSRKSARPHDRRIINTHFRFNAQIASMKKQHDDAMAAKEAAHNRDAHQRNEAYAAIQQQLMAAQDLMGR